MTDYGITLQELMENQPNINGTKHLLDINGNVIYGCCQYQQTWWTGAYEGGEQVMYKDSSGQHGWDHRIKPLWY